MRAPIGAPIVENQQLATCLDGLCSGKDVKRPVSTYRLQFNAGFTFEDARRLLPYLHALGVSHCYASPILRARAGSQHGYDITNHNEINPEIGTPAEFAAFVRDLKSLGMGLILDIVPNHMGVGHGTNPWWQDVLENGQASAHAEFFDIDWTPLKQDLRGKVLLPVLGAAYGDELESGNLRLNFEAGSFFIAYYDKHFPIDPATYPMLFDAVGDLQSFRDDTTWRETEYPELVAVLRGFRLLAAHTSTDAAEVTDRQRRIPELKQELASIYARSEGFRGLIQKVLQTLNGSPGDPRSFDALHRILEAQAYRLAHWRVSAEEINYRRFFDVNDLVGLRMENPTVFAETHKLIRQMLADGSIDGLRLDHPDGLFNPVQYFTQIQMLYAASHCCGPQPSGAVSPNGIEEDVVSLFGSRSLAQQAPLFVLVEKILEHGEHLPPDWPVDGTVGYEFGNSLNHVFINSRTQRFFTLLYHRFIGGPVNIGTVIYESKKMIMQTSLSSELTVLTHLLQDIANTDRRARDITRALLKEAIRETIACFPIYRTYIDARGTVSDRDRGYIAEAITRAKRRNQNDNPVPFDFLRSVLLLESENGNFNSDQYRKRLRFALKFQQLSGPVMAKGLEDTACYVYSRFISANEVGGSPAQFGISLEEFHNSNIERLHDWPYSMLGTSTHDSKRSEDIRARLNVLSEMPKVWSSQVTRWRRANRAKKRTLSDGRSVPDANEEYFLYQTLVGTWPLEGQTESARKGFIERIQAYMTKAIHEAKVNLSWISQNPEYVDSLTTFITHILAPGTSKRPNPFLQQFETFIRPVQYFGCINSLAQVLLKIASPGVPDIYRGTELYDFSLVDPDNRRPVDYDTRQQLLGDLVHTRSVDENASLCREIATNLTSDRAKLWLTLRALRFRRENRDLFRRGDYAPLFAAGGVREHVISFARRLESQMVIAAVPRFAYTLMKGNVAPPIGSDVWRDCVIEVPGEAGTLTNVLTGKPVEISDGHLLCREVFADFPVALLAKS
ncbi:MAG TPA: malto-oligosyltrehalose synthase [Terriglobales bacterium]|nr:malto-oligosyltrehalose synthase [Terriglobales bacterium]